MARAGAAEGAHGARPPGTRGTPARPLSCSQVRHDCNGSSHRPRPLDLHRLTLAAIDTTMSVGWQTVGRALRQGRLVDEPPPAAPTRGRSCAEHRRRSSRSGRSGGRRLPVARGDGGSAHSSRLLTRRRCHGRKRFDQSWGEGELRFARRSGAAGSCVPMRWAWGGECWVVTEEGNVSGTGVRRARPPASTQLGTICGSTGARPTSTGSTGG